MKEKKKKKKNNKKNSSNQKYKTVYHTKKMFMIRDSLVLLLYMGNMQFIFHF